ncbi:hypothetical protein O9K51_01487 [Purpureocillium lavendulum]|uniref:Uncharacterized protein n=1 Tax=Purpureocillium lavendulum TaxID=1247861 RepID=A0AB34G5D3_9HYPO|nr:hypothetical protein O9K51_01487 [Purpureocillium lavendulum]
MTAGRTCLPGCPAGSPVRGPCLRCLARDAWRIALCYDLRDLGDTLLEGLFALAVAMEAEAQEDPAAAAASRAVATAAAAVTADVDADAETGADNTHTVETDNTNTDTEECYYEEHAGRVRGALYARMRREFDCMRAGDCVTSWEGGRLANMGLEFGDVVEQMMWACGDGNENGSFPAMSEGDFVITFNKLMGHVGERVLRHRQEFLSMLSLANLNLAVAL